MWIAEVARRRRGGFGYKEGVCDDSTSASAHDYSSYTTTQSCITASYPQIMSSNTRKPCPHPYSLDVANKPTKSRITKVWVLGELVGA